MNTATVIHRNVCTNKDGLCEDDHCRCDDEVRIRPASTLAPHEVKSSVISSLFNRSDRKSFYGDLDVACRTLETIIGPFGKMWENGTDRIRPEDVARMKKYLRRASTALKEIRSTMVKFDGLNH